MGQTPAVSLCCTTRLAMKYRNHPTWWQANLGRRKSANSFWNEFCCLRHWLAQKNLSGIHAEASLSWKYRRTSFLCQQRSALWWHPNKINYEEMYVNLQCRCKKENLREECHWKIRKEISDHCSGRKGIWSFEIRAKSYAKTEVLLWFMFFFNSWNNRRSVLMNCEFLQLSILNKRLRR